MRAEDPRLAEVPFPAETPTVHTAPLPPSPPPPDQSRVPAYAKDWSHVFLKKPFRKCHKAQTKIHTYLKAMARKGTAVGLSAPPFFACGPDSLRPWARQLVLEGEVLVEGENGIELLDQSAPPPFTTSCEYWDALLRDSADRGLHDAMTKYGVVFFTQGCPLERQVVIYPPMPTLAEGMTSVRSSLRKMLKRGWFTSLAAKSEDALCLATVPARIPAMGCVDRALSDEKRLIVNNTGERRQRFTTVGVKKPIISLNWATGTRQARAAKLKAAAAAAPRAVTPAAVGVQKALAESRRYIPPGPEALPGSGQSGAPPLPPELKAYFHHLMIAIVILAAAGDTLGMEVIVFGDDFAKFFHNFALATREWWACGQLHLDPEELDAAAWEAGLVHIMERCVSMGTTPSSNYAQRAMNELIRDVLRRLDERLLPQVEQLARDNPAFKAFYDKRLRVAEASGECEVRLWWIGGYTDDPAGACLEIFAPAVLVTWDEAANASGFVRGEAYKRSLGVQLKWVGANVFTPGLLAYVGAEKRAKTVALLQDAIDGTLDVKSFVGLAGLLHHLQYVLALKRYHLMNVYDGLDKLRAAGELDDASSVPVTPRSKAALVAWRDAMAAQAGNSLLAAIFHVRPPPAQARWNIHSDAAIKGTAYPAICSNLYQHVTLYPLAKRFLELPIVFLEFVGETFLGLGAFEEVLAAAPLISLPCDSLVSPTVLAAGVAHSPLMKWALERLRAFEPFQRLLPRLVCSHEYGVGNPITDAWSRGKEEVGSAVMRQMHLEARWVSPPSYMDELMEEALMFFKALPPTTVARKRMHRESASMAAPNLAPSPFAQVPLSAISEECAELYAVLSAWHAGNLEDAGLKRLLVAMQPNARPRTATYAAVRAAVAYIRGPRPPLPRHTYWQGAGASRSRFDAWVATLRELFERCEAEVHAAAEVSLPLVASRASAQPAGISGLGAVTKHSVGARVERVDAALLILVGAPEERPRGKAKEHEFAGDMAAAGQRIESIAAEVAAAGGAQSTPHSQWLAFRAAAATLGRNSFGVGAVTRLYLELGGPAGDDSLGWARSVMLLGNALGFVVDPSSLSAGELEAVHRDVCPAAWRALVRKLKSVKKRGEMAEAIARARLENSEDAAVHAATLASLDDATRAEAVRALAAFEEEAAGAAAGSSSDHAAMVPPDSAAGGSDAPLVSSEDEVEVDSEASDGEGGVETLAAALGGVGLAKAEEEPELSWLQHAYESGGEGRRLLPSSSSPNAAAGTDALRPLGSEEQCEALEDAEAAVAGALPAVAPLGKLAALLTYRHHVPTVVTTLGVAIHFDMRVKGRTAMHPSLSQPFSLEGARLDDVYAWLLILHNLRVECEALAINLAREALEVQSVPPGSLLPGSSVALPYPYRERLGLALGAGLLVLTVALSLRWVMEIKERAARWGQRVVMAAVAETARAVGEAAQQLAILGARAGRLKIELAKHTPALADLTSRLVSSDERISDGSISSASSEGWLSDASSSVPSLVYRSDSEEGPTSLEGSDADDTASDSEASLVVPQQVAVAPLQCVTAQPRQGSWYAEASRHRAAVERRAAEEETAHLGEGYFSDVELGAFYALNCPSAAVAPDPAAAAVELEAGRALLGNPRRAVGAPGWPLRLMLLLATLAPAEAVRRPPIGPPRAPVFRPVGGWSTLLSEVGGRATLAQPDGGALFSHPFSDEESRGRSKRSSAPSMPAVMFGPAGDAVAKIAPEAWRVREAMPVQPTRTDDAGVDGLTGWADALAMDSSPMALMQGEPERLRLLLDDMNEYLELGFADSTNEKDKGHFRRWAKCCARLRTPAWRTDMAANAGVDPVGYRRELLVPALAFLMLYAEASPRSSKDPAVNPRSIMNGLYGVGRMHKKRGYQMAPFTLATRVMVGMLRKYVRDYGTESLSPERKQPLTNAIITGMLRTPHGARRKGSKLPAVDWDSDFWVAVAATLETLAETGMRKADVSKASEATAFRRGRMTFKSLRWRIAGVETASPTVAQLTSLWSGAGSAEHARDGCWLVYGALKNDAFGEFFGSKPSWLPFRSEAARCAARALARLELVAAREGMTPAKRQDTPLFGPRVGAEWHHALLDGVFDALLELGAGLTREQRHKYSVHSFRIFLACALYAADCPPERIMAMLRWKSAEALAIYARLNDGVSAAWVETTLTAVVDSKVAAHLPRLDPDEWVASLQRAADSGELGKAAQAADDAAKAGADDLWEPGAEPAHVAIARKLAKEHGLQAPPPWEGPAGAEAYEGGDEDDG